MWVEEELKPGSLSNGTVMAYQGTVNRIKQHPIGSRKLKTVTADHLQAYMDFLSFGGTNPDGTTAKALSKGDLRLFSAVLQGAFRFAVFPKRMITFNPMQYVGMAGQGTKPSNTKIVSATENCIASITTWRSKRKAVLTTRFTACRGQKKSQRDTRKYPLSASDLTAHTNHRVRWGLCAGRQAKRSRAWRAFSTSFATHSRAVCFQMEQHRGCTGASRTRQCQYHNEHLRSRYEGSEAYFRKAAG